MPYLITQHTKNNAKRLGVVVKPSINKNKKLDVFKKDGKTKIASIGSLGYGDYGTFIKKKGKEFANKRRKAYKSRHQKNRLKTGSPGYFADNLLW